MSEQLQKQIEELRMSHHLFQHRLSVLEEEQLPRRVASMEPVVKRLETKIDDLGSHFDKGLREVRDSINDQRSLQKGMIAAVIAIVGLVQLLPMLKGLVT